MLNANPATEDIIRDMAREARNGIRRIFLHWTGGRYGHNEDAYHICIDWDGTGYVLLYKRLTEKRFQWPRNEQELKLLTKQEFRWLMEGLSIVQKKAFEPGKPGTVC